MAFDVLEFEDPTPVWDSLAALSRVNSAHVDLAAEAKLPYSRFWVATPSGESEPVAYSLVWLVGDEVEIIDVATAERARRRGAALALLRTLLERYRSQARTAAFLEVRATNAPAIALYEKLGFQPTRRRAKYYANGDDAWDMRRDLTGPEPNS